jgi:ArsR family transcriptional regulator
MKTEINERKLSRLLKTLGQPTRLQILHAIGEGEACVCHLEAILGLRQAYISQHLMALRKAKILQTRREGRYIFYSLSHPKILDLIQLAGDVTNTEVPVRPLIVGETLTADCVCPTCASPS